MNSSSHSAEPDDAFTWRRRNQLSDGLAVSGNHDIFSVLDRTQQFGQAILGVGY